MKLDDYRSVPVLVVDDDKDGLWVCPGIHKHAHRFAGADRVFDECQHHLAVGNRHDFVAPKGGLHMCQCRRHRRRQLKLGGTGIGGDGIHGVVQAWQRHRQCDALPRGTDSA